MTLPPNAGPLAALPADVEAAARKVMECASVIAHTHPSLMSMAREDHHNALTALLALYRAPTPSREAVDAAPTSEAVQQAIWRYGISQWKDGNGKLSEESEATVAAEAALLALYRSPVPPPATPMPPSEVTPEDIARMRDALEPFAHFWRKTEFEASLRRSDCERAASALTGGRNAE